MEHNWIGQCFYSYQSIDKLDETYIDEFEQEIMFTHDPVTTEAERIQNIIEAKYSKADLSAIVKECETLTKFEQEKLYALLKNSNIYLMVLLVLGIQIQWI